MQKGIQLGEYSFKSTSNRVREDGKLENWEGTATGFCVVVATMTVTVADGKGGGTISMGSPTETMAA